MKCVLITKHSFCIGLDNEVLAKNDKYLLKLRREVRLPEILGAMWRSPQILDFVNTGIAVFIEIFGRWVF